MYSYMKTCVLCDTKIGFQPNGLCGACYAQYKEYIGADWFLALKKMQHNQDRIDRREGFFIPYSSATSAEGVAEQTIVSARRDRGRPTKGHTTIEKVLQIFDNDPSLSLRTIAKMVDNISYGTVRTILMKKRPEKFTQK